MLPDVGLRSRLPATAADDGNVLNGSFREWNDHIARELRDLPCSGGDRYETGPDRDLLSVCRTHAQDYQRGAQGEHTLILTHPFYLSLGEMRLLTTDGVRAEVEEYADTLLSVLRSPRDRSRVGVVALDTPYHYAAATSLLIEDGSVDRVIFTEYDQGRALDRAELEPFGDGTLYFGGLYDGRCLRGSIEDMESKLRSGTIWAIPELVLASPRDRVESLRVSSVRGLQPSQLIPLEEALHRWGMPRVPELLNSGSAVD